MDIVFLSFFLVEVTLRTHAHGWRLYLRQPLNAADAFLILVEIATSVSAFIFLCLLAIQIR